MRISRGSDSELEEENARTDAEYGWLMREYATRATLPVRFFLPVGRFDRAGGYPLLLANRHFRDVLLAKGLCVAVPGVRRRPRRSASVAASVSSCLFRS